MDLLDLIMIATKSFQSCNQSFKEMIAMCLVKDQTKRPTAEKLLKHSFFKHAKPPEVSLKSILTDLPLLCDRVKALQLKDAAQLALKKMPSSEQEALSQIEYQRGVSAWNFDIEDLKAQALLIQDDNDLSEMKEDEEFVRTSVVIKDPSTSRSNPEKSTINDKIISSRGSTSGAEFSWANSSREEILQTDIVDSGNQERVDGCDNHRLKCDLAPSTSKHEIELNQWKVEVGKKQQTYSGQLVSSGVSTTLLSEKGNTSERNERDNQQGYKRDARKVTNFSGPLMLPNRASANSLSAPMRSSTSCGDSEDKTKPNVVQIKGRFSVTSENVDLVKDLPLNNISRRSSQGSPLGKSASVGDWLVNSKPMPPGQHPKEIGNGSSKEVGNSILPASVLLPHLQNLIQQMSFQQDLVMNLLNILQQNEIVDVFQSGVPSQARNLKSEKLLDPATIERERLLLTKISELQARMICLTDDLTAAKLKHILLEQELNVLCCREEDEERRHKIEEI